MRIRIGDTVYVDSDMKLPFVVDSISKNGFVYSADGKCYPDYRLGTKGQTFAFALGIRMNKKYKVDDYPYGIYIVRERDAMKWCQREGMKFVPVLNIAFVLPDSVKELLEYAHGKSAIGDTLREGIVIRSKDGKQSFKAVDPLFLMKYDE